MVMTKLRAMTPRAAALGLALGGAALGAIATVGAPAQAATLFMGSYPDAILVAEDVNGAVTQKIKLDTGLPRSMRLSNDKKRLYVSTITTGGIEVIDTATRKVINKFSLNDEVTHYRFGDGVPDPSGKLYYTIATHYDKGADRYEVSKPQYTVIDLVQKKIVKQVDVAREDDPPSGGGGRATFMMSDDGRYLYQFRDKVLVIDTQDNFKVVERIDLAKPETAGFDSARFGGTLDTISRPGEYTTLFTSSDPYIHNKVFGVGRFNLNSREFTFTPIGPAPATMAGLQIAPDGKRAYTVVTNGLYGNKRCEFWRFDLTTNAVEAKAEFECRSRFQFGMSSKGDKLYIYGASFDIEVYDAQTLKYEATWDLGHDATGAGLAIVD